jgi:hypothetical protein
VADVQINTNVPAIHMEEILPLAVSQVHIECLLIEMFFVLVSSEKTRDAHSVRQGDAAAPEEVYEKKRGREGAFQSTEEMTQLDRSAGIQSVVHAALLRLLALRTEIVIVLL